MPKDFRGLEISGADTAVEAAIVRFQHAFLGFRDEAGEILALADTAPECAIVQVYAAAMWVYSQSEAAIAENATPLLARAAALPMGDRERLTHAAVAAWARADFTTAALRFEAIAARWPEDVTALKFAEFVFFQAPDYPRHLAFMRAAAPANRDLPAFLAMLAFAHELAGEPARAIALAEEALARDPDTPWADHAASHAFLNGGRIDEGIAALERHLDLFDGHAQGIRGHNAWHLALLHLARLDSERALALYRDRIAVADPDDVFFHTDAVGLLWRLELAGIAVPDALWAPIADAAEVRAREAVMPFLNGLYVHALVRTGRADVAAEAIATLTARKQGRGEAVWDDGLSLMRGVAALADGDAARGVALLEPVMPRIAAVGGSDAQNDLFRLAFVRGLADAGRAGDAAAAMAKRLSGRSATPFEASVAAPRLHPH